MSPTQSAVLGWTHKRLGGPLDQIREASKRLESWGLTEAPEEVATRALAIIDRAIHPNVLAIVLDTAMSHQLIATRSNLGRRSAPCRAGDTCQRGNVRRRPPRQTSDGNRYNRNELEAIRELVPSKPNETATKLRRARSADRRARIHAAGSLITRGVRRPQFRAPATAGHKCHSLGGRNA